MPVRWDFRAHADGGEARGGRKTRKLDFPRGRPDGRAGTIQVRRRRGVLGRVGNRGDFTRGRRARKYSGHRENGRASSAERPKRRRGAPATTGC